jgi:phenolphthiocerol/phthiocerol/phthiodiolone dimycocerosyl transferase
VTLSRYLDKVELQLLNAAPTQFVDYEGDLDVAALRRAFTLLCQNHPVLRARIVRDDQGYLLEAPPDQEPQLDLIPGGEDEFRAAATGPWDASSGAARLLVARQESGGIVGLRADHAIIDGRSWTAHFHQLWRLYTAIAEGEEVSVETGQSLPAPPYGVLRERWSGDKTEPESSEDDEPLNRSATIQRLESRFRLSQEETSGLREAAREAGTSVHGLICGAILVAMRAQDEDAEPASMTCLTLVDLKQRIYPPVAATESANLFGIQRSELQVSSDTPVVVLAKEIKTRLDADIAAGKVLPVDGGQLTPGAAPASSFDERFATIMVTNLGVVKAFAQPAGLRITDWRRIVQNSERTPPFPMYGVYTYDGRLSVRCNCSPAAYSTDEVDRFTERTIAELRRVASVDVHA